MTATTVTPAERRITLAALMAVLLLSTLDQTVVGTAMPRIVAELHGLELISWIRRSEANRRTPIVVVTVRDDPGSRAACASHGCAGFLTKPVDPVELTRLVSAILEGSS